VYRLLVATLESFEPAFFGYSAQLATRNDGLIYD
jgi:hypothetical protein